MPLVAAPTRGPGPSARKPAIGAAIENPIGKATFSHENASVSVPGVAIWPIGSTNRTHLDDYEKALAGELRPKDGFVLRKRRRRRLRGVGDVVPWVVSRPPAALTR